MSTRVPAGARALAIAVGAALVLESPRPASGAPATSDDPFSIVHEEQVVTGASKRPQPLSETPSAVTIITAQEIQAHGYHTLGDALRWVRGLFVTYDRSYTYVGVRGLLRPGDYNNKVLLTIDGLAVNGDAYDDATFGTELGLDMEMVERIEVVRGPGSALYGSNAVLAVVNVVMRPPSREPGLTASGHAGGQGEARAFASLSSSHAGGVAFLVGASWLGTRGADLYFPEYDSPLTQSGRAVDVDGQRATNFLGTAEWSGWHLIAKFNERMKRSPTGAFGTKFGDPRNRDYDSHNLVELSRSHRMASNLDLNFRTYWNGTRYLGYFVYGTDSASVVNVDRGDGDLFGGELRSCWSPGTHDVVTLGTEVRYHPRITFENYDQKPYALYLNTTSRRGVQAVYVQDEHRVANAATLTGGARVDRYPGFDPVVSPRIDLVYHSSPTTHWKLLTGSAFRAPSPSETDYYFEGGPPKVVLKPERVTTIEGAVSRTNGAIATSLSAYETRARDVIDLILVDAMGHTQFQNRAHTRSHGIEAEIEATRRPGVRGRFSLSWQETIDQDTRAELTNSPRWNLQLSLTHAPLDRALSVGVGLRYLSPRLTLTGSRTVGALVADGRVARRLNPDLELGLDFRNLFDSRYGDPGSREHQQDQIPQDPRTLFASFTYHPGSRQ